MNLNIKKKKLQTAINRMGLQLKINTVQFYSEDQKRMITSYVLKTPTLYYSRKFGEYRLRDYEILKTCSMVDVVLCMRDIYSQIQVWGVIRDLRDGEEIEAEKREKMVQKWVKK